jgi:hypothetical protein
MILDSESCRWQAWGSHRVRPGLGACATFLLALLVCRVAEAEPTTTGTQPPASTNSFQGPSEPDAETRTMARELALQGANAFETGDFTTALDRFNRAVSLYRAPSLTLMQARCLTRLGRHIEALDRYEETARSPLLPDSPEAYQQAVQDAKTESEALRAQVPQVVLRVVSKSQLPENLEVELDGKSVPKALINVRRPIDPGTHEVRVSAPLYETITRQITVEVGTSQLVLIPLERIPERRVIEVAPPPPLALKEKPEAVRSTASPSRGIAYVALGTGVVATSVGLVTGLIALNKKSDLDNVCAGGCPADRADEIDSWRLNRTISYVGFGVGLAATGVGAYLLIAGSPQSPKLTAAVGPGHAQLTGVF